MTDKKEFEKKFGIPKITYRADGNEERSVFIDEEVFKWIQSKQQKKIETIKMLIKGRKLWAEDGSLIPDFGVIPELRQYNKAILDVLSILEGI